MSPSDAEQEVYALFGWRRTVVGLCFRNPKVKFGYLVVVPGKSLASKQIHRTRLAVFVGGELVGVGERVKAPKKEVEAQRSTYKARTMG
jgi:hypothetical protein